MKCKKVYCWGSLFWNFTVRFGTRVNALKYQVSDFSFISAETNPTKKFPHRVERAIYSHKGPRRRAAIFSNSNSSRKTWHDRRCNYRSNRNYRKPLPPDYVKRCSQFRGLLSQRFAYLEFEGQEIDSSFRAIVFILYPPSSHPCLPFSSMKSSDFESELAFSSVDDR